MMNEVEEVVYMITNVEKLRIYILFFLVGYSKPIKVNGVHYELDAYLKQKKKKIIYLEIILLIATVIGTTYLREIKNFSYLEFTILFFLTYAVGLIIVIAVCRFFIKPKDLLNHLTKKSL